MDELRKLEGASKIDVFLQNLKSLAKLDQPQNLPTVEEVFGLEADPEREAKKDYDLEYISKRIDYMAEVFANGFYGRSPDDISTIRGLIYSYLHTHKFENGEWDYAISNESRGRFMYELIVAIEKYNPDAPKKNEIYKYLLKKLIESYAQVFRDLVEDRINLDEINLSSEVRNKIKDVVSQLKTLYVERKKYIRIMRSRDDEFDDRWAIKRWADNRALSKIDPIILDLELDLARIIAERYTTHY